MLTETREVITATAQRNISAALVIAVAIGGDTVVCTLVGALAIPVVLIVLAGEMGKRAGAAAPVAATTVAVAVR